MDIPLDPATARAAGSESPEAGERLLADALRWLVWLASGALAFAVKLDERGQVDVRMLHCAPGQDLREATTLVDRMRQLEAIDPFSPRHAAACRASVMSVVELGGVEPYARSLHGQCLRQLGYGAPLVLYLWRAERIVAGVTVIRACGSPAVDAATVRQLRRLQPLLEHAFDFAHEPRAPTPDPNAHAATLTTREFAVARLVAGGASNAEIARTLRVRQATVKAHLTHIYAKLGLSSRTQLAVTFGDVV